MTFSSSVGNEATRMNGISNGGSAVAPIAIGFIISLTGNYRKNLSVSPIPPGMVISKMRCMMSLGMPTQKSLIDTFT